MPLYRKPLSAPNPKTTYTQTYSIADTLHQTPGAVAVTTTGATTVTPAGYSTTAQANAIVTACNALRNDHLDLAELVNKIIDDLQASGMAQ